MSEKYLPTLVIAIVLLIQSLLIGLAEPSSGFLCSLVMLLVWNGVAVGVVTLPKSVRESIVPLLRQEPLAYQRRGTAFSLLLFPWLILAVATIGWLSTWLFGATAGRIVVAFLVVLIWLVLKSPDRALRPPKVKRPQRKKSKIILQ